MKLPLIFWKKKCIIWTKSLSIIALVLLLNTQSFSYETNLAHCGLSKCEVKCRCSQEVNISCVAIKRALRFFKFNGYEIKTPINIEFIQNTIQGEKERGCMPTADQFLCQYNKSTKCIKISSWADHPQWNRTAFGVFPMDLEFFTSMVTHEVAHRLFDSILESRGETTDQSFHEFVAYVTQIETMKEPNKRKTLSLWPGEKLPSVYALNSFVWMAAPNKFSILSFNFFKSQPRIIHKILNGQIKPVEMGFILNY